MTLHSVLFRSRNKDNMDVDGFKERTKAFLTHGTVEELMPQFEEFVEQGTPGEMSRFYISVNARDEKKIRQAVAIRLISQEYVNVVHLNSFALNLGDRKENSAENRWLFDYDDRDGIFQFVDEVTGCGNFKPKDVETYPTPNGYAVIVPHGFDTRNILEHYPCASLKRDDKLCITWKTKEKK